MTNSDTFRANLANLAATFPVLDVKRVRHGRDPADGLDCAGFLLWTYRACGLPIDELDMDYDAAGELWAQQLIPSRLTLAFREVPRSAITYDGDVWVTRARGLVLAFLQVGRHLWKMDDRLRACSLDTRNVGHWRVWRHRSLPA